MNKIKIENGTLWAGDSAEVLKQYPDNHFDSVVTDPPYGIEFLGKDWDKNTGAIEVWKECLRVLKPGGYMLAFSASRTYHRLATNLEDIGFEIKDQLMWLYGSGFPKAQDVGKQIAKKQGIISNKLLKSPKKEITDGTGEIRSSNEGGTTQKCSKCNGTSWIMKKCKLEDNTECIEPWIDEKLNKWSGWKTGLKPAHEPIVMCRKPLDNRIGKRGKMKSRLNVVENVEKWGVGALNIDATRVGDRFPSNVIISEEVGNDLDEKIGNKKFGNKKGGYKYDKTYNVEGFINNNKPDAPSNYGDSGGPSKYFYSPKVNRKERHIGLDMENAPRPGNTNERKDDVAWMVGNPKAEGSSEFVPRVDANTHPTIKPVALMLYLVKMITPPNGKVLDPFNGSGSTGMAVKEFNGEYVGIDLDENYIEISRKRIDAWE